MKARARPRSVAPLRCIAFTTRARHAACRAPRPPPAGAAPAQPKKKEIQRAAAVLLLHRAVRLEQRAEVDRGAVRAVGVRAVLAVSQLELQPEQPDLGHGGEAVLERMEGGRLRQQHEYAPQRLEQAGVLLGLEQLQPHVREDGRLDELHELVDLQQEGDGDLDLGELQHELRGVLVQLGQQAHREQRHRVVRPRRVERLEEGGALRVGGALLEKQPQLDGLWRGEQDEVELLHHLRGELEILLCPQPTRQRHEDLAWREVLA
eukprot:scaffold8577_cov61-Phaeocystis_antarctica.AAC.1